MALLQKLSGAFAQMRARAADAHADERVRPLREDEADLATVAKHIARLRRTEARGGDRDEDAAREAEERVGLTVERAPDSTRSGSDTGRHSHASDGARHVGMDLPWMDEAADRRPQARSAAAGQAGQAAGPAGRQEYRSSMPQSMAPAPAGPAAAGQRGLEEPRNIFLSFPAAQGLLQPDQLEMVFYNYAVPTRSGEVELLSDGSQLMMRHLLESMAAWGRATIRLGTPPHVDVAFPRSLLSHYAYRRVTLGGC
jgi:hypothetical protein